MIGHSNCFEVVVINSKIRNVKFLLDCAIRLPYCLNIQVDFNIEQGSGKSQPKADGILLRTCRDCIVDVRTETKDRIGFKNC